MKRFIGLTFALLLGMSSFAVAETSDTEGLVGDPYKARTGSQTTSSGSTCNCQQDQSSILAVQETKDLAYTNSLTPEGAVGQPAQPHQGSPVQGTDSTPGN